MLTKSPIAVTSPCLIFSVVLWGDPYPPHAANLDDIDRLFVRFLVLIVEFHSCSNASMELVLNLLFSENNSTLLNFLML